MQLEQSCDVTVTFQLEQLRRVRDTLIPIAINCGDKDLRIQLSGAFEPLDSALVTVDGDIDLKQRDAPRKSATSETRVRVLLDRDQRNALAEIFPDLKTQVGRDPDEPVELELGDVRWVWSGLIPYALKCGDARLQERLTAMFVTMSDIMDQYKIEDA